MSIPLASFLINKPKSCCESQAVPLMFSIYYFLNLTPVVSSPVKLPCCCENLVKGL